jgi:hypothetical protein
MAKKDNLAFKDVANIYNLREQSLRLYFSAVNPDFLELFFGETDSEVQDKLNYQLKEINKDACLSLLAAIEAKFRLDYNLRGQRRFRDGLSKKCKDLFREKEQRVSLEEQIFEIWKEEYPEYKSYFSILKGAFKYRHWLAHGRYWVLKAGKSDGYDFYDLYSVAVSVDALPFKEA